MIHRLTCRMSGHSLYANSYCIAVEAERTLARINLFKCRFSGTVCADRLRDRAVTMNMKHTGVLLWIHICLSLLGKLTYKTQFCQV